MTPEGKVKAKIKEILNARGKALKQFWPVQNGLGAATIDCHVCYLGFYLVIEAKAPGEKATPRQTITLEEYYDAGAWDLVVDGTDMRPLIETLDAIEEVAARREAKKKFMKTAWGL